MNCRDSDHWFNVIAYGDCHGCHIKDRVASESVFERVQQREEKRNMKKLPCNDLLLREIFIKWGDKNGNKNY